MNQKKPILLIGGPATGKTTFLGRLWLSIRNKDGKLSSDKLPDDLEYLNKISDSLFRGKFPAHTPIDSQKSAEIPIKYTGPGNPIEGKMIVPDWSGEDCMKIFHEKRWPGYWENYIAKRCSCLVFIREKVSDVPLDLVGCQKFFIPSEDGSMPDLVADTDILKEKPIPTQTIIVEWLQFLKYAFDEVIPDKSFKIRIGMIVSAWDELSRDRQEKPPYDIIKSHYPLLEQYLRTNQEYFDTEFFGVSIGGDLNDDEYKDEFVKGDPLKSGYIIHSLNGTLSESNDFTLPVTWALDLPTDEQGGS